MPRLWINADDPDMIKAIQEDQGFAFPTSANMDIPSLPSDLSELSDSGIMELFSHLTAYWNFLSAQLAVAIIDERRAEKRADAAENMALLQAHGGKTTKDTVTLLKAQVAADPEVVKLSEAYDAKYSYRKLIEVMVNNAERDTNLVSRELTRRTSSNKVVSRSNWYTP